MVGYLDGDINYEEEFNSLLNTKRLSDKVKNRFSELKREYMDKKERDFRKQLENDYYHDQLMNICISAFSPDSICYRTTGYEFVSTEPLIEKTFTEENIKNFDLLVINSKQKIAIFIECKTSTSKPGKIIADTYSAIESCNEYKNYLEDNIGNEIDFMEFVICVPASEVDHLVREIERREGFGEINVDNDPLLKIWQIDVFKGQNLQLFTRITSRKNSFQSQHRDGKLTKILAEGVEVEDSEIFVKTHPSSNPLTQGKEVIVEIFRINRDKDHDERTFTKSQIRRFFESSGTISHYASDIISYKLAEHFIGECLAYDIIEQIPEKAESYRLKIGGKKLKTVLSNYEKEYIKGFVERVATKHAKKKVVEEFRDKYGGLL